MELPDSKVLAAMSRDEFDTFWQALGVTVRVAAVAEHRKPDAKQEISNTQADTQRKWSPYVEAPASASAGFGFAGRDLSPAARVMPGYRCKFPGHQDPDCPHYG